MCLFKLWNLHYQPFLVKSKYIQSQCRNEILLIEINVHLKSPKHKTEPQNSDNFKLASIVMAHLICMLSQCFILRSVTIQTPEINIWQTANHIAASINKDDNETNLHRLKTMSFNIWKNSSTRTLPDKFSTHFMIDVKIIWYILTLNHSVCFLQCGNVPTCSLISSSQSDYFTPEIIAEPSKVCVIWSARTTQTVRKCSVCTCCPQSVRFSFFCFIFCLVSVLLFVETIEPVVLKILHK